MSWITPRKHSHIPLFQNPPLALYCGNCSLSLLPKPTISTPTKVCWSDEIPPSPPSDPVIRPPDPILISIDTQTDGIFYKSAKRLQSVSTFFGCFDSRAMNFDVILEYGWCLFDCELYMSCKMLNAGCMMPDSVAALIFKLLYLLTIRPNFFTNKTVLVHSTLIERDQRLP